ncbi:MAG: hypothetical protein M9894_23890 [Planctomycetes bacterium]|nr:hypothetical protein [Planctomycetota bacterium]
MIAGLEGVPSAAALRADLLRNRGRWDEGLAVCAQARAAGDPDLDLVVLQFRLEMAAGRPARAGAYLDELRALPPDDTPQALFARAVAGAGELDATLALLERALQLAPDKRYVHTFRARVLRQAAERAGRTDLLLRAVEAAGQAIDCDPTSPDTYGERYSAMLRLALGEPDGGRTYAPRVLADVRAARDLRPDPEMWVDAAIAHVLLDQPLEALAEATVALELGGPGWPGAERAHQWRGHARALLGEADDAAREWRLGRLGALPLATADLHARWVGRVPAAARARAFEDSPAFLAAVEAVLGQE